MPPVEYHLHKRMRGVIYKTIIWVSINSISPTYSSCTVRQHKMKRNRLINELYHLLSITWSNNGPHCALLKLPMWNGRRDLMNVKTFRMSYTQLILKNVACAKTKICVYLINREDSYLKNGMDFKSCIRSHVSLTPS